MKTKKFESYSEARSFISNLCGAYATILDQHLISLDAENELKYLDEIHNASIDYEYPYEYWMAIRERGVDGNEYKSVVKEKIAKMNDTCVCAIKVMRTEEAIVVVYKKNK